MKRINTFLLAVMSPWAICSTSASTAPNDTITCVKDAKEVTVLEDGQALHVYVRGTKEDPNYKFGYIAPKESSSILTERAGCWNFNLFKKRPRHHRWTSQMTMGGFGFGFVNAVEAPADMDVKMGASYELMCDLITLRRSSPGDRHNFSIGFGLDWRNYRMTGYQRFVKEGNDILIAPYPDGADIDFSRIKVFSLTVPLRYSYRISRHLNADLAAILNFNTYGSIKTRYSLDGKKYKDLTKNIRQSPVSVDFMFSLRYWNVGLYAKYSPCDVMQSDYAPKFQTFSSGLLFFY